MVKHNLKHYEILGLFLLFVGATWLGMGLYATILAANKSLFCPVFVGHELLIFPIFYGFGVVLMALGRIELKGVLPGKGRRQNGK